MVRIPTARVTALLVGTLALAGCGDASSKPEREADGVGTATSVQTDGPEVRMRFVPDSGYEYFDDASLVLGEDAVGHGATDQASEIRDGDRLRIWTSACAESYPVQCGVDAFEVLD